MSDLPELLDWVAQKICDFTNNHLEEIGEADFRVGLGDCRPHACEIIDTVLNREFGE